jgi:hypothetical protein
VSLIFRHRVRTSPRSWLNVSGHGVSESVRFGRVTVNSRRGVRVRLFKGLSWRA